MLRARTEEQKKNVLEIFSTNVRYCHFPLDFNKETDWGYEEFDDRIYLDGDITFDKMCEVVEYLSKENEDVEHTRTDAFIERVINFLNYKLDDVVTIRVPGTIIPYHTAKQELIEDFKNYIKGE